MRFQKTPQALLLALCGLFLFQNQNHAQLSWQRMPGPPGGFGAVTPGTGGKWLLRSSSIGVHETADGGQNWRWNALPGSIHTEAALYLGNAGRLWFFNRQQVLQSSDNGRNWVEIRPHDSGSQWIENDFFATIVLDTDTILIGANSTGILRSTDLGKTLVTVFPLAGGLNALAQNPHNGHLFAWKTSPVAGQINKIYRSTDDGLSWADWQNDPLTTGRTINQMVFAPNGAVFLATDQKLLRSTDDGASWTELNFRAGDIAVTPTGRLLAEDKDGLFTFVTRYSDDNGDSWQPGPVNLLRKFSVLPDGTIFAEYDFNGMYRSNDNGDSWQFSAYGMAHHVRRLELHFYPDNALLAITEQGVFYSENGATDWQQRFSPMNPQAISADFSPGLSTAVLPDGTVFCFFEEKLQRSTDRGVTWSDVTPAAFQPGSYFNSIRQVDGVLFFLFDNANTLRSEDGGQSWQDIGAVQLNQPEKSTDGTFWAFNFGPTLQKSTDRGLTWSNVTTPALSGPARIFSHPNGTLFLLGYGKIHRSTNGGGTWSTTNQTYMTNVNAVFVNSAGHLFVVGEQIGSDLFLLSVDEGITWQFVNDPNSFWASDFLFHAPDQRIWFASGDGVWRSTEPSTDFLTMGGTLRNDLDDDCLSDFVEPALPGFMVKSVDNNGQSRYGMSNGDGYFQVLTRAGDYQVQAVAPNELWTACSLDVTIPASPTSGLIGGKNLALKPAALCPRLEVDVAAPLLRRCFETRMAVSYRNTGTLAAANARVELVLDPLLELLDASFPVSGQSGDTLFFDLGTVNANEKGTFFLNLKVSCDAALGQMHCTSARIFPDTICSGWQGAVLRTSMQCLGDSALLEIQNIGAAAMTGQQKWQVWRGIWANFDSSLVAEGNFLLAAGEIFTKKIATGPADMLLFFKVPQETGYPFGSGFAQTVLQHCDGSGQTPYSFEYQVYEPSRAQFCLRNIGSFDPNDKAGFPEGIGAGHHIERTEPLDYLIRFQNTGTDTAFTVVIRDTLSPLLDIETLQLGAASHAVQLNVRGENELVFTFENILLPDSNINEAASHGFVKYSIRQTADNPDGAVIRNRAGIYFDFNLPVLTNETWHTVGLPIVSGVFSANQEKLPQLRVSPNPFVDLLWVEIPESFEFPNRVQRPLTLEVSDLTGRFLVKKEFENQRITLERGSMPAGLLLLSLRDASGVLLAVGRAVAR
ncbi:MAG: exo-alpha-sialidase [Lewinellaceae bacterium]|nr:exo-alpha-sialidase [Lewinellaceae bacterium]